MAPPQLNNAAIMPGSAGITDDMHLYLGKNVAVKNSSEGFITNNLPITTASVLTAGSGLNINKNGGSSALTIQSSGDLNTVGAITATGDITTASTAWANKLNIANGKATISDTGLTTIQDDFLVGSTVYVTKSTGKIHTDGPIETDSTLSVGSTINSVGTVTIGGADADSYNIQLMNTGDITAKGNFYIGSNADSDKFQVLSDSGNMTTKGTAQVDGNLTVGDDKLVVAAASGNVSAQGTFTIASGGENRFRVDGSSGEVYAKGTLTVGANSVFNVSASDGTVDQKGDLNIWNGSNKIVEISAADGSIIGHKTLSIRDSSNNDFFTVSANAGSVQVGNRASNGKVHSSFSQYVKPASYTDKLTVDDTVSTTSTTSDILTTQAYVDKAIWEQTKRINLIVGSNDTNLATFTNMFNMAQTLAGNDAVQTLNGLLDTTGEIKTSISTVMNRAYNPVAVNCSRNVWIDECAPLPIPKSVANYGLDGWYFRNLALATQGASKINWFIPANGTGMKIQHLTNLFLNIHAVSDKSLPFLTVWTAAKGNASDLFPFANASINFYFSANSASASANKPYTLYTGNSEPANCYNTNKLRCFSSSTKNATNATANGNIGTVTNVTSTTLFASSFDTSIVSPTDNIIGFLISTASTAAASDVNMIVNSLCVESRDTTSDDTRDKINGTTKFMFSNAAVATNFFYNRFYETNFDFSTINTKNKEMIEAYMPVALQ
jgi:hypothetical protein